MDVYGLPFEPHDTTSPSSRNDQPISIIHKLIAFLLSKMFDFRENWFSPIAKSSHCVLAATITLVATLFIVKHYSRQNWFDWLLSSKQKNELKKLKSSNFKL